MDEADKQDVVGATATTIQPPLQIEVPLDEEAREKSEDVMKAEHNEAGQREVGQPEKDQPEAAKDKTDAVGQPEKDQPEAAKDKTDAVGQPEKDQPEAAKDKTDAAKSEGGGKHKLHDHGKKFDCFLTHNWGKRQPDGKYDNHSRVTRVHERLTKRYGIKSWFDSEHLTGTITQKMCDGIDDSACVVVFVTKDYIGKVAGKNKDDNCQLEFLYAMKRKTKEKMLAVNFDRNCSDQRDWNGPVGMCLGSELYVDFPTDDGFDDKVHALYEEICKKLEVEPSVSATTSASPVTPAAHSRPNPSGKVMDDHAEVETLTAELTKMCACGQARARKYAQTLIGMDFYTLSSQKFRNKMKAEPNWLTDIITHAGDLQELKDHLKVIESPTARGGGPLAVRALTHNSPEHRRASDSAVFMPAAHEHRRNTEGTMNKDEIDIQAMLKKHMPGCGKERITNYAKILHTANIGNAYRLVKALVADPDWLKHHEFDDVDAEELIEGLDKEEGGLPKSFVLMHKAKKLSTADKMETFLRTPDNVKEADVAFAVLENFNTNMTKAKLVPGFCDAVLAVMDQHLKIATVADVGCQALRNLAVLKLGNDECCKIVLSVLKSYGDSSAEVVGHALGALAALAEELHLAQFLDSNGICDVLIKALRRYVTNPAVAEHALSAMMNLATVNEKIGSSLIAKGACKEVVTALEKSGQTHVRVARSGCGAVKALSEKNQNNALALGKVKACQAVVAALKSHMSDEGVAEHGCGAVMNLSVNWDNRHEMVSNQGVCDAVVTAFKLHKANPRVAKSVCGAIKNLSCPVATEKAHNLASQHRVQLGRAGACAAVAEALESCGKDDADVAELGFGAVVNLAVDDANRKGLGASRACEAVVAALRAQHSKSSLAARGCEAIRAMATTPTASIIGRRITVISSASSGSPGSPGIPGSPGSPATQTDIMQILVHTGACEAVVEAMKTHSSIDDVALHGCEAIASLAVGEYNIAKLAVAEACEVVIASLETFISTSTAVANQACAAIMNLAAVGEREKFHLKGLSEKMTKQIQAQVRKATQVVDYKIDVRAKLFESGACDLVLIALKVPQNKASADLVTHVCGAVMCLALTNDENRKVLLDLDGCNVVVEAYKAHKTGPLSQVVAQHVCGAIRALAAHDTSGAHANAVSGDRGSSSERRPSTYSSKAIEAFASASEVIVAALKAHGSTCAAVAEHGAAAVVNLVSDDQCRTKLTACGVNEAVVAALKAHSATPMAESAVKHGLEAVQSLSADAASRAKLGELDVCASVLEALRSYPESVAVATHGYHAVEGLAEDHSANTLKLGVEACELVVKALTFHKAYPAVEEAACAAIMKLAVEGTLAVELGTLGACEALLAVVTSHKSNEQYAVEMACGALMCLSADAALSKRMNDLKPSACEALLTAMAFYKYPAGIVKYAFTAIGRLATNCSDDKDRAKLVAWVSKKEVLEQGLKAHAGIDLVAEYGCRTIKELATTETNKGKLIAAGSIEAVIAILKSRANNHDSNARAVAEIGLGALASLAYSNDAKPKLTSANVGEVLIATMTSFASESPVVAECSCTVIERICSFDAGLRNKLLGGGAGASLSELVVTALKAQRAHDLVTAATLAAIKAMLSHADSKTKLQSFGAKEAVQAVLDADRSGSPALPEAIGKLAKEVITKLSACAC